MSLFISSGCCILLAWMILVLPLQWIMPAMAAAFIHEVCHYAAILLCTGRTTGIGLYSFAARIELPQMGRGKELICALAGPIGGLALWFLSPWFPRFALCALVQSVYNMLPVYPLDGGRALRCLLQLLISPVYVDVICVFIQWLTIGALLLLSAYGAFVLHMGLLPLLAVVILAFRTHNIKIPCKAAQLPVQ